MKFQNLVLGVVMGFAATQSGVWAQETTVQKQDTGTWGYGTLIGRAVRSTTPRQYFFWNTMEMVVSLGNIPWDSNYPGSSYSVDTTSTDIFNQFKTAERTDQIFLFRYVQHGWADPELEDSHTEIVKIEPIKKEPIPANLMAGIEITSGRKGWNPSANLKGRIVDVQRWGYAGHKVCTVTIEIGGILANSTSGTDTHTHEMNVYSEEGCRFAEHLMPYVPEVDVTYEHDNMEAWDSHLDILKKIEVLGDEKKNASQASVQYNRGPVQLREDDAAYQAFKERLLNDTSFTNAVVRKFMKSNQH